MINKLNEEKNIERNISHYFLCYKLIALFFF